MKVAVCFTNFGPYHLARLRALALALSERGDSLIVYEMAGNERRYPWIRAEATEPFEWVTLFARRTLEDLTRAECARAVNEALDCDRPAMRLGIVGYARPESIAMLRWALRRNIPSILMSESQEIDHPRVWWKEAVKRNRVARFSAALVGGSRHAAYLTRLGMPADKIAMGYNAIDNARFSQLAASARSSPGRRSGLPARPYFIAVSRFAAEKNFPRLVSAFTRYRTAAGGDGWDLVLCGDGEDAAEVHSSVAASGVASSIHRPGFLQSEDLIRWLAHASAFVHPSLMEPWGLVANEAAACSLPLLISDRAGCVETLVPDPPGTTGRRFAPTSVSEIAESLTWIASQAESERRAMGRRAADIVDEWGPARFARGMIEALGHAFMRRSEGSRTATEFEVVR